VTNVHTKKGTTVDRSHFAALTRALIAVPSRRHLLRGLAGAGLGLGVARLPQFAAAKKRKRKKQAARRCKQQGGPCRTFVAEGCALTEDPQACEEAFFPCCAHFERCNAGAGLTCIQGPIGEL
jgi:hypothetical protein